MMVSQMAELGGEEMADVTAEVKLTQVVAEAGEAMEKVQMSHVKAVELLLDAHALMVLLVGGQMVHKVHMVLAVLLQVLR